MRKNSPIKACKTAVVKQYQGPQQLTQNCQAIILNRQKTNFRNYFYAQKYRSVQERPTTAIDKQQEKRKLSKRDYSAKTRNSCEIPIIGMMKPFFTNFQKSQKVIQPAKIVPKNNNSETEKKKEINKGKSVNNMNQRTNEEYQKIVLDVNQLFNTNKMIGYKKKQRRVSCKKSMPNCQIINECEERYDDNLNIKGMKPNAFWSKPKSVTRELKNKHKLITQQVLNLQQTPQTIIKYHSNYLIKSNSKIFQQPSLLQQSPQKKSPSKIRQRNFHPKTITKPKIRPQIDYLGKIKPQTSVDETQLIKIMYYRDIIWKVWFNNSFKIMPAAGATPRYFVGKGNNSKLIKSIMNKRWWWKLDQKEENANFIWTQLKIYSIYQEQEEHGPICKFEADKSSEQWNKQKNEGLLQKNSFLLTKQKYTLWKQYLNSNKKLQLKASQTLDCRKPLEKQFNILTEYPKKVSNHLELSRTIGNKKALYKTLTLYHSLFSKPNQYLPVTYHITSGLQDEQYLKFLNQYYYRAKTHNKTFWIVKPGQMSNRGNGIIVCQQLNDIKAIIKNKKCHANGKPFTYIIQEYLDKPFLYNGRKFDIRYYIMITSTHGRIQGYFYEQGYIRTTSYKYSAQTKKASVHLTNDAVQKYCKEYGKYQQGNKLSYGEFEQYLQNKYKGTYNFHEMILPKIRKISIQLINSCYYLIDPKRKGHNFQIFGLDVMIDQNFKPWLIEANTNPCLELSSKILAKLIPKMLDNAFMIAIDPLFPPPNDISNRKINLPENSISQNRFQLIFDEVVDGEGLNCAYEAAEKSINLMQGCASDQEAYESAEDDNEYDF